MSTTEQTETRDPLAVLAEMRERAEYELQMAGLAPEDPLSSADDVLRLVPVVEALRDLCRDTDGNWLEPSSSLPVGEFQSALALLGEPSP